ncbi:MAG: serine/threonine-protein kinase [Nanoarchaeota archaeon]|nr:serine/threonine-protein kinase [Nanoarchaeota archaeon]
MIAKTLTEQYSLEEIGQGSQGKLYKATDKNNGEVVALKRLPLKKATSHDDVHRLEDAARALRNIDDPQVVRYLWSAERFDDCGSPEYWLALEYVDGISLAQAREEGKRFSEEELRSIARQTLEGLAAAHDKGIIHRDVKPSNILLREDGTVKITDFGIAKFLGEETRDSSIIGKGTTEYMAPEQFDPSLPITLATDYYGLGMTLLELATGRERNGAYFHEDPLQDIATLRKSGQVSETFVASLELLVDQDPEKRKEGVRQIQEKQIPAALEERVMAGIKEDETVRTREADKEIYSITIGAALGIAVGHGVGLGLLALGSTLGDYDLFGGTIMGGCIGTLCGLEHATFTDWRRRRKAEKVERKIKAYEKMLEFSAAANYTLKAGLTERTIGLYEKAGMVNTADKVAREAGLTDEHAALKEVREANV